MRDFPFYDGSPPRLRPLGWLMVLALSAAGFAALTGLPEVWPGQLGRWAGVLLFLALPLLGLHLASGVGWTALFKRPTAREVWIGLAFAPLTLLVAAGVGLVVMRVSLTAANPSAALLQSLHGADLALFLASTLPQLIGEEVITAVPFLTILAGVHRGLGCSRGVAVLVAWIGSALVFGALHLPTYAWHVAQALVVIGASRLTLSVPYLMTRNLSASAIAHVTHDWLIFAVVLAGR